MSDQTPTADLTIRTTSTGVEVIEGDCPHCGHAALDHWSDGCQGGRGGADHCRMDPWKLKQLARVLPPGGCGICGKSLSEVGTSRCYEAHGVIPSSGGDT